jgi:4,4'-diaponeurosporenoate glycosyltransferase
VLSILPYQATEAAYEQLSLFFNILMAAGAGGFGPASQPRLFGQALLVSKDVYFAVGGHAAVGGVVLENLRFADLLRRTGARIVCITGRGTLHMRMFPEGSIQMSRSWAKAFVQGAADSGGVVLASAIVWIFALWSTALMILVAPHQYGYWPLALVYFVLSMQIAWQARQLGSYSLITCLFYPIPLAYYCVIFGQSVVRRALGKKTIWRGREV